MNLLSPKSYTFPDGTITGYRIVSTVIQSHYSKEDMQKYMTILFYSNNPTNHQFLNRVANIEDWIQYNATQEMMNHCINNAEFVLRKLRQYLEHAKLASTEDLLSMDFMSMRNIFSDHVTKLNELKQVPEFSTKASLKRITKAFFQYITDRNIYTHGHLMLILMDSRMIIEYIENKATVYAEINVDILRSNNNISIMLSVFLDILESLLNHIENPIPLQQNLQTWNKLKKKFNL